MIAVPATAVSEQDQYAAPPFMFPTTMKVLHYGLMHHDERLRNAIAPAGLANRIVGTRRNNPGFKCKSILETRSVLER